MGFVNMSHADAIRGLMLLGRTREQAEREIREREDRRIEKMRHEWADSYDRMER